MHKLAAEFITIGKGIRLPLKDNYDSDVLDASQKGIEPGGATIIAWWLTTHVAAVLNSLTLDSNKIFGTMTSEVVWNDTSHDTSHLL